MRKIQYIEGLEAEFNDIGNAVMSQQIDGVYRTVSAETQFGWFHQFMYSYAISEQPQIVAVIETEQGFVVQIPIHRVRFVNTEQITK